MKQTFIGLASQRKVEIQFFSEAPPWYHVCSMTQRVELWEVIMPQVSQAHGGQNKRGTVTLFLVTY